MCLSDSRQASCYAAENDLGIWCISQFSFKLQSQTAVQYKLVLKQHLGDLLKQSLFFWLPHGQQRGLIVNSPSYNSFIHFSGCTVLLTAANKTNPFVPIAVTFTVLKYAIGQCQNKLKSLSSAEVLFMRQNSYMRLNGSKFISHPSTVIKGLVICACRWVGTVTAG